jgi:hypothetical protein
MAELVLLPPSDDELDATNSARNETMRSDYQHVNGTGSPTFQHLLDEMFDQSSSDAIRREISRADSLHRASPVRPTLQRLFDEGFENVEEFQVRIGEETQCIPRGELLDFFGTDRAETSCMVCSAQVTNGGYGPPVRTYSLDNPELPGGEDSVLALSELIVKPHNRHLNCIIETSSIGFVPISHVRHYEVSDAHLSRNHPHTGRGSLIVVVAIGPL